MKFNVYSSIITTEKRIMKARKLLIGLVVLGLFGLVGSMDYQDELAEERHYCQMVKEGNWPAFKDDVNCNDSSN